VLKIVQQTVELAATPSELYAMYLDAAAHAAFTGGGTVGIAPVAGTEWSAFAGRFHGHILALTPARQVVQSWRSFEWEAGEPDAVLVLAFAATDGGTRVDLAHVDVPERLYDTLVSGWPVRYWQPWQAYLERRR
jgi:activator of HSP90 ATPase